MTRLTYYRTALALPLAVPIVCVIILAVVPASMGDALLAAAIILAMSLLYAGVPYIIFALGVLWWSGGRRAESLVHLSFIAPVVFAPFAGLGTAIFYGAAGPRGWSFSNFAAGAGSAFIIGYLYAAAVWIFDPSRWHRRSSTEHA